MKKLLLVILGASAGAIGAAIAFILAAYNTDFPESDEWHYHHQIYGPVSQEYLLPEGDKPQSYKFTPKEADHRRIIPKNKDDNEIRIVVLGESVAARFGYWLKEHENLRILSSLWPDKKVRVINLGVGAYTSAHTLAIAREIETISPDLLLVLQGNNIFNNIDLRTWKLLRSPQRVRKSYTRYPLYRALFNLQTAAASMLDYGIYEFKRDYSELAKLLSDNNIPAIFFTLPANYLEMSPDITRYYFVNSTERFKSFILLHIGKTEELLSIAEPGYDPILWHLKGQAQFAEGYYDLARESLLKAIDIGVDIPQAGRKVNNAIKSVAGEKNIPVLEVDRIFESLSAKHIITGDFFEDHQHWYCSYNYYILADLISLISSSGLIDTFNTEDQSYAALPNCQEIELLLEADRRNVNLNALALSISGHLPNLSVLSLRKLIRYNKYMLIEALSGGPDFYIDYMSDKPYLDFIDNKVLSNWYKLNFFTGEAFRREGFTELAEEFFTEAIRLNPAHSETKLLRGILYYNTGEYKKAGEDLMDYSRTTSFFIGDRFIRSFIRQYMPEVYPTISD